MLPCADAGGGFEYLGPLRPLPFQLLSSGSRTLSLTGPPPPGAYTDSDSGLVNKLSDETQASIRDIGYLIDGQVDQPAGPLLGECLEIIV
jgi:hypothetical protein